MFSDLPNRIHNIYKDWNPSSESTINDLKNKARVSFVKKNITKKVNFSTTHLTNLTNITKLSAMDKIEEMMNTVRTKSGT